ncbi:MAG: mechanosensitive ion channel [Patescibacteria group bacterium]|nr:mechanosensitive ion channel [Patescibacteria group bacterium]
MPDSLHPLVLPTLQFVTATSVIVALVLIVYALSVRGLNALVAQKRLSGPLAYSLCRLLRWAAIVVGTMVLLEWFGVLANAWAVLSTVLALVAIGFVAVWSVLSNILCSLILLIARPFRIGDTVELPGPGLGGTVVDFTLLFTVMREKSGDLIQVPNNLFFQMPIRRHLGEATRELNEQLQRDRVDSD